MIHRGDTKEMRQKQVQERMHQGQTDFDNSSLQTITTATTTTTTTTMTARHRIHSNTLPRTDKILTCIYNYCFF